MTFGSWAIEMLSHLYRILSLPSSITFMVRQGADFLGRPFKLSNIGDHILKERRQKGDFLGIKRGSLWSNLVLFSVILVAMDLLNVRQIACKCLLVFLKRLLIY